MEPWSSGDDDATSFHVGRIQAFVSPCSSIPSPRGPSLQHNFVWLFVFVY